MTVLAGVKHPGGNPSEYDQRLIGTRVVMAHVQLSDESLGRA
jgi:hypothetical protein